MTDLAAFRRMSATAHPLFHPSPAITSPGANLYALLTIPVPLSTTITSNVASFRETARV